MKKISDLLLSLLGVSSLVLFLVVPSVSAASATISSAYDAVGKLPNGSIVSAESGRSNFVQPANTSNSQRLLGVTIRGSQSLLEVNASPHTIQVATEGTVTALVSTVNGPINIGDQVAVSPFNGVGMKAGPNSRVIGIAETSFNSSTSNAVSQKVSEINDKNQTIVVGYVRLSIVIGSANGSRTSLSGLQGLGYTLVGHPISTLRIVISLIIALIAIISIIILIYASIYGSIISIGRNPLAKRSVFRILTSVLGMVVLIAAVSGITIDLLLN